MLPSYSTTTLLSSQFKILETSSSQKPNPISSIPNSSESEAVWINKVFAICAEISDDNAIIFPSLPVTMGEEKLVPHSVVTLFAFVLIKTAGFSGEPPNSKISGFTLQPSRPGPIQL